MKQKQKLQKTLANPKGKLICVDVDGFLTLDVWYPGDPAPRPNQPIIDYVNRLYDEQAHVLIWTARRDESYAETKGWLITNGVKYHGINMNEKPPADVYLDDHCLNIDDINLSL